MLFSFYYTTKLLYENLPLLFKTNNLLCTCGGYLQTQRHAWHPGESRLRCHRQTDKPTDSTILSRVLIHETKQTTWMGIEHMCNDMSRIQAAYS